MLADKFGEFPTSQIPVFPEYSDTWKNHLHIGRSHSNSTGLKYPGNWGVISRDARKSWLKKRANHKGRT
jgi:hypothetical protein